MAGLLFLAFVYFAVGQAASLRNGAQTAADAAALAAAEDARQQLRDGWLDVVLDPTQWEEFRRGRSYVADRACRRAGDLAARNDAQIVTGACFRLDDGREGFSVKVQTASTIGRSIVPGMDAQHATASATAVIEPLCLFDPPEEPEPDPDPTPVPEEEPRPAVLTCDGEEWEVDPQDPRLPGVVDLFTVRLADEDE